VLIAWQDQLAVCHIQLDAVEIGSEPAQIVHVTTRPVVDHVHEEVLVVEDDEDRSALKLQIYIPELLIVPHKRIVDIHVEFDSLNVQELLEREIRIATHKVELTVNGGLETVGFSDPRYTNVQVGVLATF
jgi:hypothetical protein